MAYYIITINTPYSVLYYLNQQQQQQHLHHLLHLLHARHCARH